MQAFIRIVDVNGVTNSQGNVTKVIVKLEYAGLTSKQYIVKVLCSNVFPTSTAGKTINSNADSNGIETIEITALDGDISQCNCNDHIEVLATGMVVNEDNVTDSFVTQLPCGCPTLNVSTPILSENCDGLNRNVDINISVTAPVLPVVIEIDWDGSGSMKETSVVTNSAATVQFSRDLPNGTYTAIIAPLVPIGCSAKIVTFTVGECTPDVCAVIDLITVSVSEQCNDNTTRTANFSANIIGAQTSVRWSFGDGTQSPVIDPTTNPTASVSHDYVAPGNPGDPPSIYQATLTVVGVPATECLVQEEKDVLIEPCQSPCPFFGSIDNSNFLVDDKNCDDGRKNVTLSNLPIFGTKPDNIIINWGDGSQTDIYDSDQSSFNHSYVADANYEITVTLEGPGNCEAILKRTVIIDPCSNGGASDEDNNNGDNNDDNDSDNGNSSGGGLSLGCWILLILALALFIGGAVTVISGICSGAIPVGIGGGIGSLLGGILLIIWALACAKLDCSVYLKIKRMLEILIATKVIVALILTITVGLPCGLAAFASFAWDGTVYVIYINIGEKIQCLIPRND